MKTIEFKEYEINDLIRTLEYAKKKKEEEYKNERLSLSQYRFEIGLIQDLIARIPVKIYTRGNKVDKDLFD